MTNEEKQELARKVWIVNTILWIGGAIGFFTGFWFYALIFILIALPVEVMIERVFSAGISRLGRFFFPVSPAVANDLEEAESESDASATFSRAPTQSGTRSICDGLSQPISSEYPDFTTESERPSGYDSDSGSDIQSISSTDLSIGSDSDMSWSALSTSTDSGKDDEEEFVKLTENGNQLTSSLQTSNESNSVQRSLKCGAR